MPYPSSVRVIVDGTPVDAATTNGPIADLTARTDWLRQQLDSIEAGSQLLLRNRQVDPDLFVGSPVYYNDTLGRFEGALADVDTTEVSRAADSAFWIGTILAKNGGTGDILIGGAMVASHSALAQVFEDGVFTTGDVFLSAAVAGRVTTSSGSAGIYIGHIADLGSSNAEFIVRLGSPGSFTEHIHLERFLLGKPAGVANEPVSPNNQEILTPDTDERGWLPATSAYFPGFTVGVQIPTDAVFGYNIQHHDEGALRQVFPVIPDDNAQFAQEGLILNKDKVVINRFGIWWMDQSFGNAPWPPDYETTQVAEDITLWTTRLVAQASLLQTIESILLNNLAAGAAEAFAVTSLQSSNTEFLQLTGLGNNNNGYRGPVLLTPRSVLGFSGGRGLASQSSIAAPSGGGGGRGQITADVTVDIPARHLFTYLDSGNPSPGDKMVPVSTNGTASGVQLPNVYAHRLGGESDDFIDFIIDAVQDMPTGVNFRVRPTITFAVDTPTGLPSLTRNLRVRFYRVSNEEAFTEGSEVHVYTFPTEANLPNVLQRRVVPESADLYIQRGQTILARLAVDPGNPPVPDSIRVLGLSYRLTREPQP